MTFGNYSFAGVYSDEPEKLVNGIPASIQKHPHCTTYLNTGRQAYKIETSLVKIIIPLILVIEARHRFNKRYNLEINYLTKEIIGNN